MEIIIYSVPIDRKNILLNRLETIEYRILIQRAIIKKHHNYS